MNEKNKLNQLKSIISDSYCSLLRDNASVDFVSNNIHIEPIEENDDQPLRTPSSPRPKYKVTLLAKLFEDFDFANNSNNSTNNVKVTLFCDENGKISSIGFPAEDLTSHEISKSFENEVDKALNLYKKSGSEAIEFTPAEEGQISKEVLDMMLKKIKSKDILFVGESLKNRTFTDKDNNVWKYDAATQELITDNPYNLKLTDNDEDTSSNYTPKM